jgi:hypothetical protein
VPRDRDASFEPKIVAERQRRLAGVDELVISLSTEGLTTGEVQAHLAEVYGAQVSRQTISTITDKVVLVRLGRLGRGDLAKVGPTGLDGGAASWRGVVGRAAVTGVRGLVAFGARSASVISGAGSSVASAAWWAASHSTR